MNNNDSINLGGIYLEETFGYEPNIKGDKKNDKKKKQKNEINGKNKTHKNNNR